jgi:hypothetical protein
LTARKQGHANGQFGTIAVWAVFWTINSTFSYRHFFAEFFQTGGTVLYFILHRPFEYSGQKKPFVLHCNFPSDEKFGCDFCCGEMDSAAVCPNDALTQDAHSQVQLFAAVTVCMDDLSAKLRALQQAFLEDLEHQSQEISRLNSF